MPLMYLGIPMAATLNVTHAFLPPHPAPTAITDILGANLGHVLLLGILAAIPTIIITGYYKKYIRVFTAKILIFQFLANIKNSSLKRRLNSVSPF